LRLFGFLAFGAQILRIPFSIVALTPSGSMRSVKVDGARKLASTTLSDQVLCFILYSLLGLLVLILSSDLSTEIVGFAAVLGCALIA
jgi:hypothetical protein